MLRSMAHHYVAVSRDLGQWLKEKVKIAPNMVKQIYNVMDMQIFHSKDSQRHEVLPSGFADSEYVVIGTLGRIQRVKSQSMLVQAFSCLVKSHPDLAQKIRLVIVGDGPLLKELQEAVRDAHLGDLTWMPGERGNIPQVLQALDVFVLFSEAEGLSDTILKAMVLRLPSIATRVGGNAELVIEGKTGLLIPPKDPGALAILAYIQHPDFVRSHGEAGRLRVEQEFSLHSYNVEISQTL